MTAPLVVVGAGSAGAVIASRVSEDSQREVVLIEAGPDYPDDVPADLCNGRQNSVRDHDWGFRHRPTPGQNLLIFPRGRVVGGSSAVNTCIALRGNPYDYDEWAARDLPMWSWEQCFPAFRRLESDLDFPDSELHGSSGPIPIRRYVSSELVPFQRAFLSAARAFGFAPVADVNGSPTPGCGPHAMNKVDEVRMSAARCYLTSEVRRRDNLSVYPETLVRRVLFQERRAIGVEVERGGLVERIDASQVVLSAGAIATPGILLRSGVGPDRELSRLGIDRIAANEAVGAALLDHPGALMILLPRFLHARSTDPLIQTVLRYSSTDGEFPLDMQLQPGSTFTLPDVTVPLVTLMCSVGKPRGTGRLVYPTARPHEAPRIQSNFLLHPDDHRKAVEAMELATLLVAGPSLRELATFFWPRQRELRSREAIGDWIYRACGSGYHPCGTVPMGSSAQAAVDGHGRVRGVDGLVVADASIMPTVPSANINLATLMIGERFGEWIREGLYD